jgi:hypothetical protein
MVAAFEPARMLDEWTCQILESAAACGVAPRVERAQGRAPLAGRYRADGAAPLIGSSPAIREVRERIARLAANDFSVLIEGASETVKCADGASARSPLSCAPRRRTPRRTHEGACDAPPP